MKNIFIIPFLAFTISVSAQKVEEKIVKDYVYTLASDDFKGRGTSEEGEKKAADYIEKQLKKLKISPKGENGTYFQDFKFVYEEKDRTGKNVIGFIDNKAENTIIIGAHYDHLGLGNDGNSRDANPKGKIHNGADDNASGVAGILEIARVLNQNKIQEKHNYLFLFFSAEELGLIGSKYFSNNPLIDFTKVNCMINLDMVGRLDSAKNLAISGIGTSPKWSEILNKENNNRFQLKFDSAGTGASDHTSFYLKDLPVLHFFTGTHQDYHKPSDDAELINYKGEVEVIQYIIDVVTALDANEKLTFSKTKTSAATGGRKKYKVTMGIMPNYMSDGTGLAIDGVTEGNAAFNAGIKEGDVLVQIDEMTITDIQTYMQALGKYEKGQTVKVKVVREGKPLTFDLTF